MFLVLRFFHTECESLARWCFFIKTIDPYGASHTMHYHSWLKNVRILLFLFILCGRPIRFELILHAQNSCCCTRERECWRCCENQCKQTPKKKSFPREKSVDAEFLCSLISENRFILTRSLYRISFLLILHWIESACLPIIKSKTTKDHSMMWILSKNK